MTTLIDEDIPGLRYRVLNKLTTVAQEADRYSVGLETIRRAVRGETFRHIRDFLPDPPLAKPPKEDHRAEESLQRVKESLGEDAEESAVDKFLAARKKES